MIHIGEWENQTINYLEFWGCFKVFLLKKKKKIVHHEIHVLNKIFHIIVCKDLSIGNIICLVDTYNEKYDRKWFGL